MTSSSHDRGRQSDSAETQSYTPQPTSRAHPIWLARAFLLPRAGEGDPAAPEWRFAPHWFLLWGLVVGVVYAGVFRAAWRWFGEYQYIRFVPVAIVLVVDLAWGGYRPLIAGVRLLGSSRRAAGEDGPIHIVLALASIAILKYSLLLSLPLGDSEQPGWRSQLGILYPKPIYRPLILMPLWGRWAMTLALCIGRPAPDAPARLVSMAAGARLPGILVGWIVCGVLTALYASETAKDLPRGTLISLGVLVASYLVSFAWARRLSGQTEASVSSTALAAELAFLALYLPVVSRVFHY